MSRRRYSLKATATVSCIYAAGMLLCIGYLYLVPSMFDYWGPASEVSIRMVTTKHRPSSTSRRLSNCVRGTPTLTTYRGYSLGAQGDYEGALASFDAALELKPDDSRVLSASRPSPCFVGRGSRRRSMSVPGSTSRRGSMSMHSAAPPTSSSSMPWPTTCWSQETWNRQRGCSARPLPPIRPGLSVTTVWGACSTAVDGLVRRWKRTLAQRPWIQPSRTWATRSAGCGSRFRPGQ